MVLENVREYSEGMKVELTMHRGRLCIRAYNEGGYNCTEVDFYDLMNAVADLVMRAYSN